MKAFFEEGEMRKVEVIANLWIAVYPEEQDSTMIGLNAGEGSLLHMYLLDGKMKKGVMIGKSNGILYPMDQIPPDKMKLPAFQWFDYIRPRDKEDIFEWRGKRAGETLNKSNRRSTNTTNKRDLIKQ